MKLLTRYWFTFTRTSKPSPLNVGCGVTAFGYADALELLREHLAPEDVARVAGHVENIDVSTLDPGHVLPNLGIVSDRGIWFPVACKVISK
jgi:hypothetical protein